MLRTQEHARSLRKAVRLFISVPELYMLIGGLYSSLKAIAFGAIMLVVMIMVWAVVSVEVLHPIVADMAFPTCDRCKDGFKDVFAASVTIFQQIVAGDSWGAISVPLVAAWLIFKHKLLFLFKLLSRSSCLSDFHAGSGVSSVLL